MKLIKRTSSSREEEISYIFRRNFPVTGIETRNAIKNLKQKGRNFVADDPEYLSELWNELPSWKAIIFTHVDGAYDNAATDDYALLNDDEDDSDDVAVALTPLGQNLFAHLVSEIQALDDELAKMSASSLNEIYLAERGRATEHDGVAAADQPLRSDKPGATGGPELTEVLSTLAQRETEIQKLQDLVANLETEAEKKFSTRERNNLLKLLISIVKEKYRYDPTLERNETHRKLEGLMTQHVGKGITDEIIREKLKEAARFLVSDESEGAQTKARTKRIS